MTGIEATWMRGGTSKCWVFRAEDLEVPGRSVDEVLLRLFGSPDHRQVDGVGGGTSTTSKAVILAPSNTPDVDVDYTFAQVGTAEAKVDWGSNCGNCSAVVAPFAVRNGWVPVTGERTQVRVRNTNTDQMILQHVNTRGGALDPDPVTSIPGVPTPGAPVEMGFVAPEGRSTGSLFPSGNVVDHLTVDGVTIDATLVDAGAPVVVVRADDVGMTATELPAEIDAQQHLLARLDAIRRAGAVAMDMVATPAEAARAVPKMAVVAAAGTDAEADLLVRMLSMGKVHPALPITGSVALTMAARQEGTLVSDLLRQPPTERFTMLSPAGVITTRYSTDHEQSVVSAIRTYRVLADASLPLPVASSS